MYSNDGVYIILTVGAVKTVMAVIEYESALPDQSRSSIQSYCGINNINTLQWTVMNLITTLVSFDLQLLDSSYLLQKCLPDDSAYSASTNVPIMLLLCFWFASPSSPPVLIHCGHHMLLFCTVSDSHTLFRSTSTCPIRTWQVGIPLTHLLSCTDQKALRTQRG